VLSSNSIAATALSASMITFHLMIGKGQANPADPGKRKRILDIETRNKHIRKLLNVSMQHVRDVATLCRQSCEHRPGAWGEVLCVAGLRNVILRGGEESRE
jgi:hypothetical protein